MLDVPVALVTFNRPEPTKLCFEQIRRAKPSRLFLISDGPRIDRPKERELVEESRGIVETIDWPCAVNRIKSDTNMGCGSRISSGITRAF
jgi:hypothetical protein